MCNPALTLPWRPFLFTDVFSVNLSWREWRNTADFHLYVNVLSVHLDWSENIRNVQIKYNPFPHSLCISVLIKWKELESVVVWFVPLYVLWSICGNTTQVKVHTHKKCRYMWKYLTVVRGPVTCLRLQSTWLLQGQWDFPASALLLVVLLNRLCRMRTELCFPPCTLEVVIAAPTIVWRMNVFGLPAELCAWNTTPAIYLAGEKEMTPGR